MAQNRDKFLELIQDEKNILKMVAAKTPEDGAAFLAENGVEVSAEEFTSLMSSIDDSLPDDLVEAIAGGTYTDNWNIDGVQFNDTFNYKVVVKELTDVSTNIFSSTTINNLTINNN